MFKSIARGFARTKAMLAVAFASVVAFTAAPSLALATPVAPSTTVIAKIEEYGSEAVLIIVAFIVVLWGLKALGLLGSRR